MNKVIRGFKEFNKVNENDDDRPFRLYGEGNTPEAELIAMLKDLISMINSANPVDQESYDVIKEDIRNATSDIKSHSGFEELKNGIPWQDGFIKLSDWSSELKEAVMVMNKKASKKGLA